MANNSTLGNAKAAKNDEFYTQLPDIEQEMQAYVDWNPQVFRDKTILLPCDDPEWSNFTRYFALNFQLFGIRKLISTSYAPDAKAAKYGLQPPLFPTQLAEKSYGIGAAGSPPPIGGGWGEALKSKWQTRGRIFVLDRDVNGDNRIDIDDLRWEYLEGDGDFRSKEVTRLRDEADIIITNPPFSLFREFLKWIIDGGKQFSIIGNMNAVSYNEMFILLRDNKAWLGATGNSSDMVFGVPEGTNVSEKDRLKAEKLGYRGNYTRLGNSCWYTNIEHGLRHEPIPLMTMADNLKFSRHKELRGKKAYIHYDNYDAIEVPYTDAIPSDYDGVMGVPKSFLAKYCPEQFKIVGIGTGEIAKSLGVTKNYRGRTDIQMTIDGKPQCPYERILIQKLQREPVSGI